MIKRFHNQNKRKRRGEGLPARLRFVARRGTTLVELLIAMLILTIVCIAWLEIIGVQSARKEARRREAVERLAGMMDAFMYENRNNHSLNFGDYRMNLNLLIGKIDFEYCGDSDVHPMYEQEISPVGYRISVVTKDDLPGQIWFDGWEDLEQKGEEPLVARWVVGRLYNQNGRLADAGKPFFTLPVCFGF